jgi:hypothetical protein
VTRLIVVIFCCSWALLGCDSVLGISPVSLLDAGTDLGMEDAGADAGGTTPADAGVTSDAGVASNAGEDPDAGTDRNLGHDAGPGQVRLIAGGIRSVPGALRASSLTISVSGFEEQSTPCVTTHCLTGGITP